MPVGTLYLECCMLDPASVPPPKPAVSPAAAGASRVVAKEDGGFQGRLREALDAPQADQQAGRPGVEAKPADCRDDDRPVQPASKGEAASIEVDSAEPVAGGAQTQADKVSNAATAAPELQAAASPNVADATLPEAPLTDTAMNEGAAGQVAPPTLDAPASAISLQAAAMPLATQAAVTLPGGADAQLSSSDTGVAQSLARQTSGVAPAQASVIAAAAQPMARTPMPETQAIAEGPAAQAAPVSGALPDPSVATPAAGPVDGKAGVVANQSERAGAAGFAPSEAVAMQPGIQVEAEAQAGPTAEQLRSQMQAAQVAQQDAASRSAPAAAPDQQQNIANALAGAPAQAAAAQAAPPQQAVAGARKPAPLAPAGDAVEATKPAEPLSLLAKALNHIDLAGEMKVVVAAEAAEAGLRLASVEAPKALGAKPSGEMRAEGLAMPPAGFMGPDGMLQRADAPPPSSPAREFSAPLPARQLAPVVVSLALGRGDEALTIALDPIELGRVEVSIGQGKEAGQVRIVAERPETLALLQRDQRELDRALNQAGLGDMGRSLSFSLASDQGRQQQQHAAHQGANRFASALTGVEPERPLGPIPVPARAATSLIDIAV